MKHYTIDLTYNLGKFESEEQALAAFHELAQNELAYIVKSEAELTEHELEG